MRSIKEIEEEVKQHELERQVAREKANLLIGNYRNHSRTTPELDNVLDDLYQLMNEEEIPKYYQYDIGLSGLSLGNLIKLSEIGETVSVNCSILLGHEAAKFESVSSLIHQLNAAIIREFMERSKQLT